MAFERQQNVTITGRAGVSLDLYIPDPDDPDDVQYGKINVTLHLSNGQTKNIRYDLLARLGDDPTGLTHRSNLLAMRDYILARIDSEVLPTP
jgi:hypothetical protein